MYNRRQVEKEIKVGRVKLNEIKMYIDKIVLRVCERFILLTRCGFAK